MEARLDGMYCGRVQTVMNVEKAFLRGARESGLLVNWEGREKGSIPLRLDIKPYRPQVRADRRQRLVCVRTLRGRQRAQQSPPISSRHENVLGRCLRHRVICRVRTRRLEPVST